MPWAVSSSLGDNKLFIGPKHNIYALFMILFGLILLFVCQICHVNCETEIENKRNLFKKKKDQENKPQGLKYYVAYMNTLVLVEAVRTNFH